jgi:hypothetical protein
MEVDVFHRPAVGGILREKFVEARLHIDDFAHPEVIERTTKLQDELAGARATPYYLVVDPATRKVRARFPGPDAPPVGDGSKFAEFLQKALH